MVPLMNWLLSINSTAAGKYKQNSIRGNGLAVCGKEQAPLALTGIIVVICPSEVKICFDPTQSMSGLASREVTP